MPLGAGARAGVQNALGGGIIHAVTMDRELASHGLARREADRHAELIAQPLADAKIGDRRDPEALELGRRADSTAEQHRR